MTTFLIILGILIVLLSAFLTIGACIASARFSQSEDWAERPIHVRQSSPVQLAAQPARAGRSLNGDS